ncbi:MAG: type III pantothenate kinase [Chthoniobacterales bacterium]|jgi:type III pantothenate kinase
MPDGVTYPLLVIDAGNTAVKFASVQRPDASPKLLATMATEKLSAARARKFFPAAASIVISSVVPAASRTLRLAFPAARFLGPRTPLNFTTRVDRRTVGSDRLANMAAAAQRRKSSVLVIGCGTATTFDVLDADGVHQGGAIAPGWRTFATALAAKAAKIPAVKLRRPVSWTGRNTRDALTAGIAGGYGAMVDGLIDRLAGPRRWRVVFTGGDAALVAGLIRHKVFLDPLWTLRGIAILGRQSGLGGRN